jgi:RNA polymerase sigma-70 factor (ECF subfamily)
MTSPPGAASPEEDAPLVRRALAGDEMAYRDLLARYRNRVYGLALRMVQNADDAADIAQEAFVKAFQSLATFDLTKSFGAWIAKIAANLCIDHYRRRRLALVSLDAPIDTDRGERTRELADGRPAPDELLGAGESERRMDALVESLPPRYRMAVVLRYKEDLAYEEIASILDIPLGTVKARLHRAHRLLKRKLRPALVERHERRER